MVPDVAHQASSRCILGIKCPLELFVEGVRVAPDDVIRESGCWPGGEQAVVRRTSCSTARSDAARRLLTMPGIEESDARPFANRA